MQNLITYFQQRISLTKDEINVLKRIVKVEDISAKTVLIKEGIVEEYVYFIIKGIVKGYKINDGKIIIEHLVDSNNFFTPLDSFINNTKSKDYFETITTCSLCKISKTNLDLLKRSGNKWSTFIETVTNEHLLCKMERVSDFQTLTAKERYLKFVKQSPNLALNVSVDNIASFLGIEPQSLSRIRKQIIV